MSSAAQRGGPLRIDVVTLFPGLFSGALDHSILARAIARGSVEVRLHDLREHGLGTHRQVDDAPFGGGGGMVLRPEPLFAAVEAVTGRPAGQHPPDEAVVLLTPSGEPHDQRRARRWSGLRRLVLLCGRYEGVDERVRTHLCSEAVSVGDFVMSGGEPAALAVIDSVVRLLPGVLGNEQSSVTESHEQLLLEAPHYTRPASFRDVAVPPELLSGDHAGIARWRRRAALKLTARTRPDLLARARQEGLVASAEDDDAELSMVHDHGGLMSGDREGAPEEGSTR